MKLAEALILRADLQRSINELDSRLGNNLLYQEGDKPSEDPEKLLEEIDMKISEMTDIVIRINKTNNNTEVEDGIYLSDLLAKREGISKKRAVYSGAVDQGSSKVNRYSATEIRYLSAIDVEKLQKITDELSKEWRELDIKIQGLNWTIDLLD